MCFCSSYDIETKLLFVQQRAEIGKKVYAPMVENKSVAIPMPSGQPLYLQRYTMNNFTVACA